MKQKAGGDAAATTAATTSGGNTASQTTTTNAATAEPTSDPSKGATVGCVWPDDGRKDVTFTKGCSLVAKHNLTMDEGATLTFEEGVKVSFDTDTYMWVDYGKMVVKGTDAAPVIFTSSNKSPAPGDWAGIGFKEKTSAGTTIDHLIVEYAGSKAASGVGGIHVETMRQGGRISITNTTVRSSSQFGLVADDNATFGKFENNMFKENKSGSVRAFAEVLGSFGRGNTFSQPIHVVNSKVDQTTTWPPFDVPVLIDGNIEIASDSSVPTLTIADKTIMKMGQDTYFDIGGSPGALVAKNVTFTSNSPSPSEGDWATIFIKRKSNGTDIENCTFEYFGSSSAGARGGITLWGMSATDLKGVKIANNTFRKGKQDAMHSDDGKCDPYDKTNKVEGIPFCNKP
jgi:hypothetical protein